MKAKKPIRRWYRYRTTMAHETSYWRYVFTYHAEAKERAYGEADQAGRYAGYSGGVDPEDYQLQPIKAPPRAWLESELKSALGQVKLMRQSLSSLNLIPARRRKKP